MIHTLVFEENYEFSSKQDKVNKAFSLMPGIV